MRVRQISCQLKYLTMKICLKYYFFTVHHHCNLFVMTFLLLTIAFILHFESFIIHRKFPLWLNYLTVYDWFYGCSHGWFCVHSHKLSARLRMRNFAERRVALVYFSRKSSSALITRTFVACKRSIVNKWMMIIYAAMGNQCACRAQIRTQNGFTLIALSRYRRGG